MMWLIKINHFPILSKFGLFFIRLTCAVKFDFSVSALVHCLATLQTVETGFSLCKFFPVALFKALKW